MDDETNFVRLKKIKRLRQRYKYKYYPEFILTLMFFSSQNSDGQFSSAQISPSQHAQTPPDKNIINNMSESNPIMFSKLTGRQEIRLKVKQGEGVLGPKVRIGDPL